MKTKKILVLLLLAVACLGVQTVVSQEASATPGALSRVITIDDAVQLAMNNNLSLQRIALNLNTTKRTADRSWNSLLPTLNAGALISHPSSIVDDILPPVTVGPMGLQDRIVWTPGFTLSAGLTLSASVIENIKRTRSDYEAGVLTLEAAKQDLELQVRKLFYQILLLDANRELAAQNFQSAEIRYEQTAARVRSGQAPSLDELSARVDMENLRPSVMNAEIHYENAMDAFKVILGIPAEIKIVLIGSISSEIAAEISVNDAGYAESMEASRLLQSIRSMTAQKNAVRNSAYLPSLRLSWTSTPVYNLQHGYWIDNGSFSISLGMSLDSLFPWSSARTQIQTINDNIRSAEIQLTEIMRNRENRINQNIRTVDRIMESLEAMQLNVELAQSTYEMMEDAYRRGAADYQRLQGAGDSLAMARNRLLQEQFNLVSALLDLEKELNIPFGSLSEPVGRSF